MQESINNVSHRVIGDGGRRTAGQPCAVCAHAVLTVLRNLTTPLDVGGWSEKHRPNAPATHSTLKRSNDSVKCPNERLVVY